jgi:diguanylate cyclase (GGDEF)-like protein/PAS domain S-box-containing protein
MFLSQVPPEESFRTSAKAHILVVDDQLSMLQSVEALLRLKGYEVAVAADGEKALARLQEESFDLILLDLQMPGTSGFDILTTIDKKRLGCAVVVVSGQSSFLNVKRVMKLGALDFLLKPYNPEDLLATVQQALNEAAQKIRRQNRERKILNSARMYRFIVNHSPDFIYVLNRQGHFSYVNNKVESLLGYRRDELIGQHFSKIIHPNNDVEIHNCFSEPHGGMQSIDKLEMWLKINPDKQQQDRQNTCKLIAEVDAISFYKKNQGTKVFAGTLGCIRDISARKRREAQINYQAYHDLLTRLPNRALFDDRMKQLFAHSSRKGEKFALILMDIDRFKQVNDNFGHAMGDCVLQQVSERVQTCLRAEDTLCRFGGDEFTLLLPSIPSREAAITVIEKVLETVRQPFDIDGHSLYLSVSMGVALYPDAGDTQESLLHSADIAMYQVKADGKDGYRFYSADLARDVAILSAERELYQAFEQQQFQVFFQPKVDPKQQMIVGMEALLRWQHPQRGLRYPDEFLEIAEQSRLIVPIGAWVLRTVCSELLRWRKQGVPEIKVSLNISPVQLEEDDFSQQFIRTLEEFDLPGQLFTVEITEKGLLRAEQGIVRKLKKLRDYGVSVTLDDFGSGFSSLSCLQSAAVDTLKIDRSFVHEINDKEQVSSIAESIALLAKGLRMQVIAEGVESRLQLDYLTTLGCKEVQGYLYSPPVSAADMQAFLLSRPQNGPHFSFH